MTSIAQFPSLADLPAALIAFQPRRRRAQALWQHVELKLVHRDGRVVDPELYDSRGRRFAETRPGGLLDERA